MSNDHATNAYDVQIARIQTENKKIDLIQSIFANKGDTNQVKEILTLIRPMSEMETGLVEHSKFSQVDPMAQASSPAQAPQEESNENKSKGTIEWIEDPSGKSRPQYVLDACRDIIMQKKSIVVEAVVALLRSYGRYAVTDDKARTEKQHGSTSACLNELTSDLYLTREYCGNVAVWKPTKQTKKGNYQHKYPKRQSRIGREKFKARNLRECIWAYILQRPASMGAFRYSREIKEMKAFPAIKHVLETECPYPNDTALCTAIGSQVGDMAKENPPRLIKKGVFYEIAPSFKHMQQQTQQVNFLQQ